MPGTISGAAAIKRFFEADGGREVKFPELKELRAASAAGYDEVARLSAEALGLELEAPKS